MKKNDLIDLLHRYERMLDAGQNLYFDADQYDSLAEYYDHSDELSKAKEVVEAGLNIHPNNDQLLLKKARFYIYDMLYVEALEFMNSHFNTYDYDLFLLKIECYLHLGFYAEAYELTQYILEDEYTDETLSELGFLYIEANYLDEGILYLEKSLEYNPNNKDVLADLAYAYESNNDLDKVIKITNQLLDLEPYNSDYWLLLGKVYTQLDDYEKAIDAFDFVSTIEDNDTSFLKLKAHCLVLVDRIDEAIEILIECIEATPFDEYLYISLADCYLKTEKFNEVLDLVSKYEEDLEESSSVLLAKKAYAYCLMENYTQSLIFISKSIDLDSNNYDVNSAAIDIFVKMKMYANALLACQRILSDRDNDIDVLDKAVSLSVQVTNLDLAIAYQKKIIALDNTTERIHKLALLYLENNDKLEFNNCINNFDTDALQSFFSLFYEIELLDKTQLTDELMKLKLQEAYKCRLLYKVIKH